MNYFNYFTEVENEFVKRRGKHLLVSPLDWSLIEVWKQRGIPLHIVLRGINTSFDGYDKRLRRGRKVNTLFFCQQEVEALFLEYCDARVGSNDFIAGKDNATNGNGQAADNATFSRARVTEYLREQHAALAQLSRAHAADWPLAEAFERAATRLQQLIDDLNAVPTLDAEALESDLSLLEELILEALKQSAGDEGLTQLELEGNQQLRAYREQMAREVYVQTLNNFIARRLRERYQAPRLSLFYL
jgi:hypothetical protein